jgi:ATP-dependent exoDNAse (exonuclease V) beta subunit
MNPALAGPDEDRLLREDMAARRDALDATRSFLVQAPAGSGKTELLIQRLLALLARVDEPERILALTFTRKAAGEMRERVLEALTAAARQDPLDTAQPHLAVTRDLALAVLAQDARQGWALREHPARLRIMTFDALTTWIVRSAPFAAGLGPAPGYAEDAKGLYAEAATAAIVDAAADDPHWRRLLAHLHNDADQAARLIAKLLARRDQLLREVGVAGPGAVREALVAALRDEIDSALSTLARAFPADIAPEIARLARYAAGGLPREAPLAQGLLACADCGGVPAFDAHGLPLWRALAAWLLTHEGEPRKSLDKRQGFPAAGNGPGKAERVAAKEDMLALLDRLRAVPGLAATLHGVATMPEPAVPGAAAWEVVEALLHVVPRAVAELAVAFARSGEVDFSQASLAALDALGPPDAPSDLLQRLDYRLMHLLVDEFQDTSATQLELLRRLTAGWTPGEDGRTLFAVGDPMQSIYRFREAEVRLFVEAQLAGAVAGIPVTGLTLRRNFRSQRPIVEWVNRVFRRVLGEVSDPVRGAVAFAPATAVKSASPGDGVSLALHASERDEAAAVVAHVREAIAANAPEVAILVRARTHLETILPALREAGIAFTAVELDRLGQRQAVKDLLSLTHALLQPGDRLAWLAVLRAPWCGLALADLVALSDAALARPLPEALDDAAAIATLSENGRQRVARVRPILAAARAAHGRASVAARVRGAWLALGGPACLGDALDLDTAERFFDVLARHERAADVPDWGAFCAELDELAAAPEPATEPGAAPTRVQVMTMHKAKGLQFDTVILPGLGRKGRGASQELLRWRRRRRGLLIAPSPSPGSDPDPVFDYLKRLEREESDAELGRLLYVACTRAMSRLHLVGAPPIDGTKDAPEWRPASSSSLAKLWTVLEGEAPAAIATGAEPAGDAVAPPLERLPLHYAPPVADDGLAPRRAPAGATFEAPPFEWAQERTRVVGTLAHRWLARVAAGGRWDEAQIGALAPRVRADLASAGFADDEAGPFAERVLDVVRRTLADPRGRWLFDPAHVDARSEWAIAGVDAGELVHVVVDRTFVEDGVRWVVDFKTGSHEGGDAASFLDSEAARYRGQLERYARIASALDGRPVRIALYHPLVPGGFREL